MLKIIKRLFESRNQKVVDKIKQCFINKTDIKIDTFDKINAEAITMFLGLIGKHKKTFDNEKLMSLVSKYDEIKSSIPLEQRIFGGYSIRCSQEDFEERYLVFRFSKISNKAYEKIKADLVEKI